MNELRLPEWLIKLIIIVALPTVTCFGFYSVDHLDSNNSLLILLVILSYPVALIGIIGAFRVLYLHEKTKIKLSFWILCIVVSVIIQLATRL